MAVYFQIYRIFIASFLIFLYVSYMYFSRYSLEFMKLYCFFL
jgi:hypothetical protein